MTREQWRTHPRYPAQTLLLGSHENFRHLQHHLMTMVENADVFHHAERLFARWMEAMGGHEAYEEGKLYPYLEHRWSVSMEPLRAGHGALAARRQALYGAFDQGDPVLVRNAARGFGQVLLEHLDLEERVVIPLLLELEPEEFQQYYNLPIRLLLKF